MAEATRSGEGKSPVSGRTNKQLGDISDNISDLKQTSKTSLDIELLKAPSPRSLMAPKGAGGYT